MFTSSSHFWCSGVRKDHCWAQWNLGRETAQDRGHSHGEVSRSGSMPFPFHLRLTVFEDVEFKSTSSPPSVLTCLTTLPQLNLSLRPLCCPPDSFHLSVSLPLNSFCLFALSFLSSHPAAQMMLWHSPPFHCSVICFCRCQMCYSIHSLLCSSLSCHI